MQHHHIELERVMRAACAGDEHAWRSLVERFGGRIRSVARAHRLAAHDSEDVVQTTWLRLLENIARVREPASVGAWLSTTARRESLSVIGDRKAEEPVPSELVPEPEPAPAPSEALLAAERRAVLGRAVGSLPERSAALVRMLFADREPSYVEISATLGMPVGSIGPIRGRALERLRAHGELRALADDGTEML
jgi:RNA polymerase sigma factor (sigma-70 family)